MYFHDHDHERDRYHIQRLNQYCVHGDDYDDGCDGDEGCGFNCVDDDDDGGDMVLSYGGGDVVALQINHGLSDCAFLSSLLVYETSDDSDELRLFHHHPTSYHDRIATDYLPYHPIHSAI